MSEPKTEEEVAGRPMTDAALAEWVRDTCLLFGTTVQTAYQVAGLFIEALNQETYHAPV